MSYDLTSQQTNKQRLQLYRDKLPAVMYSRLMLGMNSCFPDSPAHPGKKVHLKKPLQSLNYFCRHMENKVFGNKLYAHLRISLTIML